MILLYTCYDHVMLIYVCEKYVILLCTCNNNARPLSDVIIITSSRAVSFLGVFYFYRCYFLIMIFFLTSVFVLVITVTILGSRSFLNVVVILKKKIHSGSGWWCWGNWIIISFFLIFILFDFAHLWMKLREIRRKKTLNAQRHYARNFLHSVVMVMMSPCEIIIFQEL